MDEQRAYALRVAAEVLPRELEHVTSSDAATLQSLCSDEEPTLAAMLASSFVTFLLSPPGDATSKLTSTLPESEGRGLAELYWRCLVAVALMPEPVLENLASHYEASKNHGKHNEIQN